jgi:filamentous hemagglutinin
MHVLQLKPQKTVSATSSKTDIFYKHRTLSEKIANGHAYDKHVLKQGEFRGLVRNKDDLAKHTEMVLNNPSEVKKLVRNRTGYWHHETETIVIHDPTTYDAGTVFQPKIGYEYFEKRIR